MRASNRNYAFAFALVAALEDLGLRHAVVCPGSRSTPLALAFAESAVVTDWSHIDERAGAFFALGAAKSLGSPVAVVTTSGTAAAELMPAAVEAHHAGVPLLLLTADRPPHLRHVGAPQAIDQVKLFGDAVRWFHDPGLPSTDANVLRRVGTMAAQAWGRAVGGGPVHLNLPFDDPLTPRPVAGDVPEPFPEVSTPRYLPPRADPEPEAIDVIASQLGGRRAMIVAGPMDDPGAAPAIAALGATLGIPVVADALSGLRRGGHRLDAVVSSGHLLAATGWMDAQPPQAVLRFGALPTSKALFSFLERLGGPHVLVAEVGWRDPLGVAGTMVAADPSTVALALAKVAEPAPPGWLEAWSSAERAATEAIADAIAASGFPTEPAITAALGSSLPAGAVLWASSSMPVRDVDSYLACGPTPLRVLANRGANGIDGVISSALGSAAALAAPTVAVAGDLAVLHDLSGLAAAVRHDIPLTVVAVHNDGGGIFEFLPQADGPHFERHLGTPHGFDLVAIATSLGLDTAEPASAEELAALMAQASAVPRLVQVRTDRKDNVAVHRAIADAVAAAVHPAT